MGFHFEQHRLGLWDLSWDLKKTISWEMGLGPPLHDPHDWHDVSITDIPCIKIARSGEEVIQYEELGTLKAVF